MKYLYLVNRFNLGKNSEVIMQKLREVSDEAGREYDIVVHDSVDDAIRTARSLRDTEGIVTAIGGDGTVNLLLNDLMGTKNVLSCIPLGTGNDFYRANAGILKEGIHEVDVIRINDRYFINAGCFGIDADIANDERFIHNHLIPRSMRYHASVLYHFLTHRHGRMLKIDFDGQSIQQRCATVVAANSQYYGGGYWISPGSSITDGQMELYIVDDLPKLKIANIILSMKKAGHLNNPALKRIATNSAVISSAQPFGANIDGETLISDRFELELIPKGIRVELDAKFVRRIGLG